MRKSLYQALVFLCCGCLILAFTGPLYGGTEKDTPRIVMVGIGAKNPTFDENRFPDLNIVYTPGLVSQARIGKTGKAALGIFGRESGAQEIYKGTPEILEKWWDKKDLRNHAILFDKNGIGSWEGWIDREDDIRKSKGKGKKKKLGQMLERIVVKGETTDFDEGKNFKPKKDDALLKRKMPDFEVATPLGETMQVSSLIEDGVPTLVIFFQISQDVDVQKWKESGKGKSSGAFLKDMVAGVAGTQWDLMFERLQGQFFD